MNFLVLVSGNGSNLQALIDAERAGRFAPLGAGNGAASPEKEGRIAAVLSDRAGVFALERAKTAGIPALTEEPDRRLVQPGERQRDLSRRILCAAREWKADLIILAGFLSILRGEIIREYEGRIINIHPSLLPKYGGPGMYGDRVHRAVLAAGEKESGCTVHLVDEGTDTGSILLQRTIPVLAEDTVETLAERIHQEEHVAIVEAAAAMVAKLRKPE
ncbi:MAG: phosphoribosylglycinamide formyltransferase [Treponema sp.]|jgi:phosphoribosylglycinamide formyltransferase-1|nr:phosphoribosylglycinamide formyltransferase [Treponema sp.]